MKYETYIVTVPVNAPIDGRPSLEDIQNEKFDDTVAVEDKLNPSGENMEIGIYSMCSFMDACNNTDDDCPQDEKIIISECWVGYVQIKTK